MPPSRGLLSSAISGAKLHSKSRPLPTTPIQRQFSTRLSTNGASPSAFRISQIRPSLNIRTLAPTTARSISLWPFGSNSSQDASTFSDQHQVLPKPAETGNLTSTIPPSPSTNSAHISPTSEPTAVSTSPTPDTTPFDVQLLSIDDITPVATDLHTVPEKIGYFADLGLNFGWGPTSILQWTLEHIHIYTGCPWWGSILITATLIRLASLPLVIMQSDQMARGQPFREEQTAIMEKKFRAQANSDAILQREADRESAHLRQVAGLDMRKQFGPIVIQMMVGVATFRFYRTAAEIPVPGWQAGGFGWITDLNLTDPLYLTPFLFAGAMHALGRLGGESGAGLTGQAAQVSKYIRPVMLYGLPAIVCATMFWMPIALQLGFLTSLIFGIGQSVLLRKPGIRARLGIAPLITQQPGQAENASGAPMMSKLNLAPTYQPPASSNSSKPVESVSNPVDNSKKGIKGMLSQQFDAAKKWKSGVGSDLQKYRNLRQGQSEDTSGRSEAYKRKAKAYEENQRKLAEYDSRNSRR